MPARKGARSRRVYPRTLQELRAIGCYWRARIVGTAFHLGLFQWLGTHSKSAAVISKHIGGRSQDWQIFLDALAVLNLLRKRGNRYANSNLIVRALHAQMASSLLPDFDAWNLWGRLPEILTGGNRPKIAQPFFTDRIKAERLLRALDDDAQKIAPHVIRRLPLSHAKTVLDVGGGLGALALACCRRFPKLHATILEHPNVAPLTRANVKKSRVKNRVQVIALDVFKDSWPRGSFDAVLASNILHGQGARENRSLIASAYKCLNPGGYLIVRDVLGGADATDPAWGSLFSVGLLVQTPKGRCYSLKEVRGWLHQAGFSDVQGPLASSPLFFDPDSVLITRKN